MYSLSLTVLEFSCILTLSTLFFLISGYWLLRSLKDLMLMTICGITDIPKAKMILVVVVLVVIAVYNCILDTDVPKHFLFFLFRNF